MTGVCGWLWRASACAAIVLVAGCSAIGNVLPRLPFADGGHGRNLTIAILPWAYRAPVGGFPCDLCPDRLVLAPTSREDALFVTAFFHEALTRHPRFVVVDEETVAAVIGGSMAETAERLRVQTSLDAVLVGALLELRPRQGDPRDPSRRAGAAVYAALVEPSTGTPLWTGFLDEDEHAPGRMKRQLGRLTGSAGGIARSAIEVARWEVNRMAEDLVKQVR